VKHSGLNVVPPSVDLNNLSNSIETQTFRGFTGSIATSDAGQGSLVPRSQPNVAAEY
jgi:hypothetical protein